MRYAAYSGFSIQRLVSHVSLDIRGMGLGLQAACEPCVIALEFKFLCSTDAMQRMVLSSGPCVQRNSSYEYSICYRSDFCLQGSCWSPLRL